PFTGHFVHAIHIDGFQKLGLDKRHRVGPAVRLPRSRIHDAGSPVLTLACLEDCQGGDGVHLEILKWLLHRFDMADVSGQVEYVSFAANELEHEREIRAIALDDFDVVLDRVDVEVVRTAGRMKGIQNRDRCAELHETDGEITSDEAEAACD